MKLWFIIKNLKYIPYRIWYGVENLFKWLPIIWNDRDWDYTYMLLLIDKKLKHMEKFFVNGSLESADKNVADIKQAREHLSYMIYEENSPVFNEYYEKYPIVDMFNLIRNERQNETPEEREIRIEWFRELVKEEHKFQEEQKNKFFQILNDNIQSWWD